jgi:hypothetical protein
MKRLLLFSLIAYLFCISCEDDINYIDNPPQLELAVMDSDSTKIEGAIVKLFKELKDWENQTNIVKQGLTSNEGVIVFDSLETKSYYFYVEKGKLNNYYGTAQLGGSLSTNYKKTVKVIIKPLPN